MIKSKTYIATPPGATIKEQLKERGMSQKEFAVRMDLTEKHVSKLINGDVQLTPEMAVRLEMVLGVPAQFWNNLEAIYREKLIKAKAENEMEDDEVLARLLPYSEMAKYEWVPATRDIKEKVVNLRKYFEVVKLSVLDNAQLKSIACRRLAITEKSDFALLAWAQKAKLEARMIETKAFDFEGLKQLLPNLRKMTSQKQEELFPNLQACLAEVGVALVFLPHLSGSFLQGATFRDGKKVVIGLTARRKESDVFWLSLFHELAHIVLGHIAIEGGTTEEDEKKANEWAENMLIPRHQLEVFLEKKDTSEESILRFAKEIEIDPGIVVGRLQREGVLDYNALNHLKKRYEIFT